MGKKNPQSRPNFLNLVDCQTEDSSYLERESRYVIYMQDPESPASVGRFFAVSTCDGEGSVIIAEDSLVCSVKMSVSNFYTHIGHCVTYVFKASIVDQEEDTGSWPYVTKGCGDKLKEYRTSREICVGCGNALLRFGGTEALLYGFHPPKRIWHARLRCSSHGCRARHWYNYRVRKSGKLYFEDAGRDCTIFVNAQTAFDKTLIEYIQKLHYRGFVSMAAVSRVHAAIFKSPSTKNFTRLLTDAFSSITQFVSSVWPG